MQIVACGVRVASHKVCRNGIGAAAAHVISGGWNPVRSVLDANAVLSKTLLVHTFGGA